MTARSRASQNFLALGKHDWRVHGDAKCARGESEYDIDMKLTGCGDDEFTCGSGDCLEMKKRCNHIPNCQDESNEKGCKNMVFHERYKKWMPPITLRRDAIMPAQVNVSLRIHRVISIEEEHHSIKLQLETSLKWKDYRLTYYNLKPDLYLKTLSSEEMKRL